MNTPNLALLFSKICSNTNTSSDNEIPVYCLIRISSTHHSVDNVIGIYFDKDRADEECEKFKATLSKRSQHKIYVQTSILRK